MDGNVGQVSVRKGPSWIGVDPNNPQILGKIWQRVGHNKMNENHSTEKKDTAEFHWNWK